MNHKQQHTYDAIMQEPVSGNIHWHDIESLLKALNAEFQAHRGARMHIVLNGVEGTLNRPHHGSVLSKQDIRHLRQYLLRAKP